MEQEKIFEEHIELKEAQRLIREGKLLEGKYMGDKSYFKIGKQLFKVKTENNRALFGDVVAFEISPIEQWEKRIVKKIEEEEVEEVGNQEGDA